MSGRIYTSHYPPVAGIHLGWERPIGLVVFLVLYDRDQSHLALDEHTVIWHSVQEQSIGGNNANNKQRTMHFFRLTLARFG